MEWVQQLSGGEGFQTEMVTIDQIKYYVDSHPKLLIREKVMLMKAIQVILEISDFGYIGEIDQGANTINSHYGNNDTSGNMGLPYENENSINNGSSPNVTRALRIAECFLRDGPGSLDVAYIQTCTTCHAWKRKGCRNLSACSPNLGKHAFIHMNNTVLCAYCGNKYKTSLTCLNHRSFHRWSHELYRVVYSTSDTIASFSIDNVISANIDVGTSNSKMEEKEIDEVVSIECKLCGTPYNQ